MVPPKKMPELEELIEWLPRRRSSGIHTCSIRLSPQVEVWMEFNLLPRTAA